LEELSQIGTFLAQKELPREGPLGEKTFFNVLTV